MAGARTRGASPDVENNPTSQSRSLTGAPFSGTRPQIPHSMSTSSWPSATVRSYSGPRPITTLPLEKSNSGNENLRLETQGATRRELSSRSCRQTAETFAPRVGYGNLAAIRALGNHARLRRLPGGARSPSKPASPQTKFPANREFIRELPLRLVMRQGPCASGELKSLIRGGHSRPTGWRLCTSHGASRPKN
jgi:hypothetical protein